MSAPVLHHVYTSVRGYRTHHASPGFDADTVARLEDLAGRLYPHVRARPLRAFLRLGEVDGHGHPCVGMCLVEAAPFGTDDSGRPRVCVRSAVIEAPVVSVQPFLNPFPLWPALFPPLEDGLLGLTQRLPQAIESPPLSGQLAAAAAALRAPGSAAPALLRSLLSGARTTVVIGERRATVDLLGAVWPLLPPRVRHRVAAVTGPLPINLGAFGSPSVLWLAPDPPPDLTALEAEGHVVIDAATGAAGAHLPAAHAYGSWLAAHGAAPDDALRRTLLFLERHDSLAEAAHFLFNQLNEALIQLSPMLDPAGGITVGRSPRAAAAVLVPLCRAGLTGAADGLIQKIVGRLKERGGLRARIADAAASARSAARQFTPDAERFVGAFANSIGEARPRRLESSGFYPSSDKILFMLEDEESD